MSGWLHVSASSPEKKSLHTNWVPRMSEVHSHLRQGLKNASLCQELNHSHNCPTLSLFRGGKRENNNNLELIWLEILNFSIKVFNQLNFEVGNATNVWCFNQRKQSTISTVNSYPEIMYIRKKKAEYVFINYHMCFENLVLHVQNQICFLLTHGLNQMHLSFFTHITSKQCFCQVVYLYTFLLPCLWVHQLRELYKQ